jgi:hypothetical protein
MPKFKEEENKKLDRQIRENINDMTKKIKECEAHIKFISYYKAEDSHQQTSNIK